MANWRPNGKQWMAIWPAAIVGGLSLLAGMWLAGAAILAAGAAAVWYLDPRGKQPENMAIRSVRCAGCGAIGEPHWHRCPKCGGTAWVRES
jgi:hypothetical protein